MQVPTGSGPVPAYARVGRVVAAAVVAAVVLAGCSGEQPQPGTLPPVRSASSTSAPASPSATPTSVEQQIRAAVYAYYAELTRAAQTSDTSRLKTMVTDGCPCYRAITMINKSARLAESAPDAAWRVRSIRVRDVQDLTALALVRYSVAPYRVLSRDGAVVARFPRTSRYVGLSFVQYQGRWVIGNTFDMEG